MTELGAIERIENARVAHGRRARNAHRSRRGETRLCGFVALEEPQFGFFGVEEALAERWLKIGVAAARPAELGAVAHRAAV